MGKESTAPRMPAASVGARLREIRLSLGASQTAFARALRVSQSYLSAVETERANPNIDILAGLAREYPWIDLRWFVSGAGAMLAPHPVVMGAADDEAMTVAIRVAWPRFEKRIRQQRGRLFRDQAHARDGGSPFHWLARLLLLLYEHYLVSYRELRKSGAPEQVARVGAADRCQQYAGELDKIARPDQPE